MRLVKPSHKILAVTPLPLLLMELAGRTCYKSEDKITQDSAIEFVKMILKRGHESVIEHVSASIRFVCDRGVTHEIIRHRLASYSQESTRYVNYQGGCAFIIPPWLDLPEGEYEREQDITIVPPANGARVWIRNRFENERQYNELIAMGWRPEMARGELPSCTKTEIVMTANLREWRHFFKLRAASIAAHPQMRELAIPALMDMKAVFAPVFDDIIPAGVPEVNPAH